MDRLRVVVFGTYDLDAHPRSRVLIEGLRAHGAEVEEYNVALGLDTAARVDLLRRPWTAPRLVARIVGRWVRLWQLAGAAATGGAPIDAVLVPYLGHFDVHLARRRFPRTPIVLDHLISGSDTARDRGVGGPLRGRLLAALDSAAVRSADVAVVDTDEHLDLLPEWARPRGLVVPVGAADGWVTARRPLYDGSRPLRVIFFGLFTPLQGATTIGAALGLLAGERQIEVTMVGTGQDRDAARVLAAANDRVEWLGMVPAGELPALTADHDVCLGIFADNPKGRRVVPNKVFQGLRAGCAVVTSDTPPQRRVLGDLAVYVPPADAAALAATLRSLAADPPRVAALQEAARRSSDRFGPAGVVQPLVDRLVRPCGSPSHGGGPRRA